MMLFRVKVCGLTRPRDGQLAASLGADLAGMIFFRKSPRFVTRQQAREIVAALPPTVARVGVFVNESPEVMLRVAEQIRLDYLQLHGEEPVSVIRYLQRHGYRVIKAFNIRSVKDYDTLHITPADLTLIDHRAGEIRGGTGKTFDWSLHSQRHFPRLVLAGGLKVDNVSDGVKLFRPLVVDVNSGIESRPGVKSPKLMKEFFAQCDRIRYGA